MFGARFCTETACSAHICAHIHHPPQPGAPPHPTADLVSLSSSLSGCFHLPCTSSTCFRLHTIEYPAGSRAQPESTSYDPSESSRHRIQVRVRVSGPVYHLSRKTAAIEFGFESAAKSILHRNPVDIEFGLPAHWQPAGESVIHRNPVVVEFGSESESAAQYIIQNLNSSPRIRVVGAILHPTRT